mmetsp:Transcript_34445/g.70348  ORF Transcript_34445/g.70348 Transcript_34445/m.70348 type:complete len:331 (+) Transcript_34445:109-1101(+)
MRRNTSMLNQPRYSVSRSLVFLLFMVSFAGADGMGPCLAVTAVGTLVAATVFVRKSSSRALSEPDAPIEITKKSPMQQWAKQFQDDWKKKRFLGSRGGGGVRDGEEWGPDFLFESRRGSSSFSVVLHSPGFVGGSSMLIPSAIRSKSSKRQARNRKSAATVGSTAGCIARIELRLSRFGSMEPTRDALRALSVEIDKADAAAAAAAAAPALAWLQGGQKAGRKTGKGGLPLSTPSSSSSSSSKHSDKPKSTFPVLVDMTTSVACSPAVLNVVVSFMRTYGGRFGHVSLVGRSAAMDMARLCISLARLKRFRVFPDFAELQKALDEGTWEI